MKTAIWIVSLVWLFCGGVTFAEQLEIPVQSSEQKSQACEEALQGVGQALRSAASVETCLLAPDFSTVTCAILLPANAATHASLISRSWRPPPLKAVAVNTPALLCIYRI